MALCDVLCQAIYARESDEGFRWDRLHCPATSARRPAAFAAPPQRRSSRHCLARCLAHFLAHTALIPTLPCCRHCLAHCISALTCTSPSQAELGAHSALWTRRPHPPRTSHVCWTASHRRPLRPRPRHAKDCKWWGGGGGVWGVLEARAANVGAAPLSSSSVPHAPRPALTFRRSKRQRSPSSHCFQAILPAFSCTWDFSRAARPPRCGRVVCVAVPRAARQCPAHLPHPPTLIHPPLPCPPTPLTPLAVLGQAGESPAHRAGRRGAVLVDGVRVSLQPCSSKPTDLTLKVILTVPPFPLQRRLHARPARAAPAVHAGRQPGLERCVLACQRRGGQGGGWGFLAAA